MNKLKAWDGLDATGQYQYPIEQIKHWSMQIDAAGSIYYVPQGAGVEALIWCPAHKLTRRLHRLEQLEARK